MLLMFLKYLKQCFFYFFKYKLKTDQNMCTLKNLEEILKI